jgi:hypothetical protein
MEALIAEDAALEVVEAVVKQAGDMLYDNYLRRREVPHACDRAMADLMNVIGYKPLSHSDLLSIIELSSPECILQVV